ncbi:hypothetical protein BMS3Abin03_01242 [bacterium BMS3Abin03]|nr:hypothetical protein BMS3Abin03_01242 [bacterium BMS3Abin03]
MNRSSSKINKINKLQTYELLPLICSSAALRMDELLRIFLIEAKKRNINKILIYESLLQNYLFTGYPSALIALKILKEIYPGDNSAETEDWDLNKYRERGVKNCKKIYGRKYSKLISNIKSFSPELSNWLVLEGYGKVLGRKNLSLKQRELNIIAVLAVQKFDEQLYSHINGAYRQKIETEKIRRVILNLKLLGEDSFSAFGMKVLKRYLKKKGAN